MGVFVQIDPKTGEQTIDWDNTNQKDFTDNFWEQLKIQLEDQYECELQWGEIKKCASESGNSQ